MKKTLLRLAAILVAAALGVGIVASPAVAASYPNRPVTLVVPFPPGGNSDITARIFAEALAKELGVPIVVDNKGGAGGTIGARYVAAAKADGYTLLLSTSSTNGTNPAVYKDLPYDPVNGFTPVTEIARVPGVLCVNKDFEAQTYKDLVTLIRASPGKYAYASSGAGGATHLAMEYLKSYDQLDVTHVPYRGSGPALNDVIGGQVPMIWDTLTATLPHIKAGSLVPLAITGPVRFAGLPDVPTFAELGLTGYDAETRNGVLAPAGLPPEILEKLSTAAIAALAHPQVRQKYANLASRVIANSPEGYRDVIEQEVAKWKKVAVDANITLQ